MRAYATVSLKFPSQSRLKTVFLSLVPETRSPSSTRSHANLTKDGLFLVLSVEAKDTAALRATLNAYLRWINSVLNILDVVGAQKRKDTVP
jgi:tRNA threonylcarbamoyladenosine modification (KEOPS) complex  Pcc1 subunit